MDKFDRIYELHRVFSTCRTPVAIDELKTRLERSVPGVYRLLALLRDRELESLKAGRGRRRRWNLPLPIREEKIGSITHKRTGRETGEPRNYRKRPERCERTLPYRRRLGGRRTRLRPRDVRCRPRRATASGQHAPRHGGAGIAGLQTARPRFR